MSYNQILHCVQDDSLALMSFPLPLLEGVPTGEGGLFLSLYGRECPQGKGGHFSLLRFQFLPHHPIEHSAEDAGEDENKNRAYLEEFHCDKCHNKQCYTYAELQW